MNERFYVNSPLASGPFMLQGPEAHHLATVRRLRVEDRVCLFNGDGREYPAEVRSVRRRDVELHVGPAACPQREIGLRLEVAAPVPKGDRAQFLLEKLTELGATAFVPLRTGRSVIEPSEAKLEKLNRYVIEASKQCGRNVLLHVQPLTEWEIYCRSASLPAVRVVAHPGGSPPSTNPNLARGTDVALAVGPEGGLTDEEVNLAVAAGWQVVDLGPRILRVETAALVLAVLAIPRQ
jgi:16S rRNA (uracil1498-N3)-methyltransferase